MPEENLGGDRGFPDSSGVETDKKGERPHLPVHGPSRVRKDSVSIIRRNRRLKGYIKQLEHDFESLVESRRWKIGDAIVRILKLDIRGRSKPGSLSHARKVLREFKTEQARIQSSKKNIGRPRQARSVEELMSHLEESIRALSASTRFRLGCMFVRIPWILRFQRKEPESSLGEILEIIDRYRDLRGQGEPISPWKVNAWINQISSLYQRFLSSSQWRIGNSFVHAVRAILLLKRSRMATDYVEDLLRDYEWGGYALESYTDETGAWQGPAVPAVNKEPGKIAVVMHVFYRELLPELLEKLGNLEEDYDLFVTVPEEAFGEIEPDLRQLAPDCFPRFFRFATKDVFPFLRVVQELRLLGYEYVCKIHTGRKHPEFGALWRECLLDGVLGSKLLTREILGAFRDNSALQSVGSALIYMPVNGNIYDGREKLDELLGNVFGDGSGPDEWGFFSGAMFWGRVAGLSKLAGRVLGEGNGSASLESGCLLSRDELLERMLGVVPVLESGQVGLVDYLSAAPGLERTLTCADNPEPILLPLRYRIRAFDLVKKGIFKKYNLLMESGLLDSCYYLSRKPEILDGSRDCFEDYLQSGEVDFLNQEHEEGRFTLNFKGDCLEIEGDGPTKTVRLAADDISSLAGWKALPDRNNPPDSEILVSIICMTFNHEGFIRQALEGFLSQKTDFKFEVIIGDDCSRDSTPEIVQEYADRFPDLFVFIRRTENLGTRANAIDLRSRIRGKYVIQSEGDDYWIDPLKLQYQVDHMEAHPECSVCFHPVLVIDECCPEKQYVFPTVPGEVVGSRLCLEHILERNLFQTCSVMYRWQLHEAEDEYYDDRLFPGDWYNHVLHARFGEIHKIERVMAVYRRHPGGMWSSISPGLSLLKKWGGHQLQFIRAVNKKLSNRYHVSLIKNARGMFVDLARFYFDEMNMDGLYELIDSNRDFAPLSFHALNWPLELDNIHSPEDLAREFRLAFRVSTIVTSFNHEEYIEECLESVLTQKGLFTHEVIVADDFSGDRTPEIIQHYVETCPGGIRVLPSGENLGPHRNLARALEACQGDFIAICEGDDYWISAEKIHKQLSFLLKNPEMKMCFNRLLLLKEKSSESVPHPGQEDLEGDRVNWEQLLPGNFIANFSCCFYRREAVNAIKDIFFQEEYAADWLFNLLVSRDSDIGFVREFLSVYRINERGFWSGKPAIEKDRRMEEMYQRFLACFPEKKHLVRKYAVRIRSGRQLEKDR